MPVITRAHRATLDLLHWAWQLKHASTPEEDYDDRLFCSYETFQACLRTPCWFTGPISVEIQHLITPH